MFIYQCQSPSPSLSLPTSPLATTNLFSMCMSLFLFRSVQFSCSVMSDSSAPWTAACQASLSIINFQNLLKLMSIKSVMPYNHLILCRLLPHLPSIFPTISVFSNESVLRIRWPKLWHFSFSISPFNEYSRLISFRVNLFNPCSPSESQESSPQFKLWSLNC